MPHFPPCYNISMKLRRVAAGLSAGAVLLLPLAVFAQGALSQPIVPERCQGARAAWECSVCDLAQLAQNLLNAGVYILVALAAVMFAWAGFEFLTAAGSSEKYGRAKRVFSNVIVGLVILLVSWVAVDTLMKSFVKQGSGGFGPWNEVCYRGGGGAAP